MFQHGRMFGRAPALVIWKTLVVGKTRDSHLLRVRPPCDFRSMPPRGCCACCRRRQRMGCRFDCCHGCRTACSARAKATIPSWQSACSDSISQPRGPGRRLRQERRGLAPALALGFGFVEIGSVTPRPQPGNPKPRLFRLRRIAPSSTGSASTATALEVVARRACAARERARHGSRPVGVNLGKNKRTGDDAADYVAGVRALAPLADYLVVNVSSPNTPGLRELQGRAPLERLLSGRCRRAPRWYRTIRRRCC